MAYQLIIKIYDGHDTLRTTCIEFSTQREAEAALRLAEAAAEEVKDYD